MKLYIDPGTGAMLFAMLTGLIGIAGYFLKGLRVKLRFLLSGGKKADEDEEVIPFVIFSDDKRYWPVFEPICRELNERGFDVIYMTASPDDPALQNEYEHVHAEFIGEGNKAFMRLNFLKATMLLSTTPGLDVYQWKRSKDVAYYIHIPHMPGELTTYRMFGLDYYDALMLSGQYQIDDCRALEKLRGLSEKECTIVGIPYLDEKAKRLEAAIPQPHERTVLVAPSWGSNSLFNRYGTKLIDELIATGYHIIIRPHPQSFTSEKELIERLMADYPQLEWNRDTDNFDVLNRSDIMISDFSGVIFDFSLVFDKPVICAYTDFDASQDDAWWLDTPIWTATAIPRIGPILSEHNLPQIKRMIDCCLTDQSYSDNRNALREETWANRGKGATLAVDYLINKYRELLTETEDSIKQSDNDQEANIAHADETFVSKLPSYSNMPSENDTTVVIEETNMEVGDVVGSTETVDAQKPVDIVDTAKAEDNTPLQEKKASHNRFIFVLIGIGIIAMVAFLVLRYALIQYTEKQYERADLELMRAALAASEMKIAQSPIEEKADYWFNSKTLQLLPADYDKPQGYGLGTTIVGGASEDFYNKYTEDGQRVFKYEENLDYTDKIIRVTIDPDEKMVTLRWVAGNNISDNNVSTD